MTSKDPNNSSSDVLVEASIQVSESELPASPPEVSSEETSSGGGASLRSLVISGSAWTVVGFGLRRVVQLGSHLILARLLLPDVFGIMLMVSIIQAGLEMLSDVGIGAALIQHRDGEKPAYRNTAWTVKAFRGIFLWLATCALAWPVAVYREDPIFLTLLPVAGLSAVINGFSSISVVILHRNLVLKPITILEIVQQFIHISVMIILASIWPSPWSLVIGGLAGRVFWFVASYTMVPHGACRFCWDRAALSHLIRFGRWVFIGSALTYAIGHGDRIFMSSFMTNAKLGMYGIAFMMAMTMPQAIRELSLKVLFPLYSRLAKQSADTLRSKMFLVRALLLTASMPPMCLIIVYGDVIVQFLYKPEYWESGWMLRVLAIGGLFSCIGTTSIPVLLAVGDSFRNMKYVTASAIILVLSMAIGGYLAGEVGIVAGVAASSIASYPAVVWATRKYHAWMPGLDLTAVIICSCLTALGLFIRA